MKRPTKKITFWKCPVCGLNSSDRQKVQKHFERSHTITAEEIVYCNICGAGWYVNAYGAAKASELANECYQKHMEAGECDEIAARTFFLSGGAFGYVQNIKGGRAKNGKKEDSERNAPESI